MSIEKSLKKKILIKQETGSLLQKQEKQRKLKISRRKVVITVSSLYSAIMLMFWNVRGLNDPQKQKRLKSILRQYNGNLVCLLETHVLEEKSSAIMQSMLAGWNSLEKYEVSPLGRIWLLYDNRVSVSMYKKSSQAIHYHVFSSVLNKYYFLSVVYASYDE